jgi:UDP-N-acetylglucosamine transferase subunit ALG13
LPDFWINLKKISKNTPIIGPKYRKFLISPLDWGLGHATRIIPVIHYLKQLECQIWIACSGATEKVLKESFPDIPFLKLEGYGVKYPDNKRHFGWKIIGQLPRIMSAVKAEQLWLEKNQAIYQWDVVISDNRYGLFHPQLESVFITHQVNIKTGMGNWTDKIVRWINRFYINKFDQCWIPDQRGNINLAGELSHGSIPANAVYIGPLSRFSHSNKSEEGYLLIVLSGPEPQRSMLEEILLAQLHGYNRPVKIVRGLPAEIVKPENTAGIEWFNHLPASALQGMIEQAGLVICRSGYTTVMDLVRLQKKAILIPTPGQAEQEYLASYLMQEGIFLSANQSDFNVQKELEKAAHFSPKYPSLKYDAFKEVIHQLVYG